MAGSFGISDGYGRLVGYETKTIGHPIDDRSLHFISKKLTHCKDSLQLEMRDCRLSTTIFFLQDCRQASEKDCTPQQIQQVQSCFDMGITQSSPSDGPMQTT